jgi:indole-3-glycerol phosphate synthase
MINTVPDILARIVEHKRNELKQLPAPIRVLEERAETNSGSRRGFARALRARHPAIIAEIKKASPSKGLLTSNFEPRRTARQYESGGAAALSVLTDEKYFQGSLNDLQAARKEVSLPVLRKDFTIDRYHVFEAAANAADAILLIAAILETREMRDFRELAASYGMDAIVEVHNEHELSAAVDSGAEIIGVNNRDLHTFQVSLETSLRLAARIPEHVLKISESGIETRDQIRLLQESGFQALLMGEHLMRSSDPADVLRKLTA